MVLAVVDDLMFSSKIRAAAEHAGAAVMFARSMDAVMTGVREQRPRLVIVDLDRSATDPSAIIAALKADAETKTVEIVGYVSHVNAARIDEARAAGIDRVMARSAFVQALPQLIGGQAVPPAPES